MMPFSWFKSSRQAQLDRIEGALVQLLRLSTREFSTIERHQTMTDYTLDDIIANAEAEKTEVDSLITLTAGLKTQLEAALNGEPISPAGHARFNKIFADIQAQRDAIAAAVIANTPSAPAEPEPDAPPVDTPPPNPPTDSAGAPPAAPVA